MWRKAAGATYVARWTTFHVRQLAKSIKEILNRTGFSFIEVISPCPTLYQRRNKQGDGLDAMKYYKANSKIRHRAPTAETGLGLQGEITVGKFVDIERPSYMATLHHQLSERLGEKYVCTEDLTCQ